MTRRMVVWVTDAESELTELWLLSKSRNQISQASQSIDATLREHAGSVGVVLSEGLKAHDEPPLRVLFEILDDDQMVRILKVKLIA